MISANSNNDPGTTIDANLHGQPVATGPSPTAWQRVILTFTAPSRAFQQLGAGRSWWLPYLLVVLIGFGFVASIGSRVGWQTVARTNLAASAKQQGKFDQLPAAQQESQIAVIARITQVTAYLSPVLAPLVVGAIVAGLLLATFNFSMGASARFGPLIAVYFFSSLPVALKSLLSILTFYLPGFSPEAFQINNALGSNPAFYLQGTSVPHALLALLSWLDLFLIWQWVILIIGCAIVAKVSRGRAATVVLGWVLVMMLISTATAALT